MILDGHSRTEAARLNGMERQTLRDGVHRYNAEGLAGLVSKVGPGPAPLLTEAQMAELRELVVKGPDPERDGVVRWRCVNLQDQVARRFSVVTTERTIGRWLRRLKLTRVQPLARRQYRGDERASGRNQHAGETRCALPPRLRWRRMAPERRAADCARQHHNAAPAALRAGIKPHGKCLGLPARKQAQQPALRYLRRDAPSLQTGVALPHR